MPPVGTSYWAVFGFVAALAFCPVASIAQSATEAIGRDLALTVAELEKDRALVLTRIQECDATISKSQSIIDAARAKANVQAEQIATAARKRAEEAKAKNQAILRMMDSTLKNFKARTSGSPESISAEERALAKERIADLRNDIAKIQESLRSCIDSTTKSLAEREALERQISAAYDRSWKALQEGLMDLGTVGLSKLYALRAASIKATMDNAWKIVRETSDPLRKERVLGVIEWLQREENLVKYNSALVQHAGELKTAHDVYQWDRKEAPFPDQLAESMDLMAGMISAYYTPAKMSYIGLSSVNAELSAWHRLREVDRENAGCSTEGKSLSFRMGKKMEEIGCLDGCLDNPSSGCVDKCRGKTALATPPPLPE